MNSYKPTTRPAARRLPADYAANRQVGKARIAGYCPCTCPRRRVAHRRWAFLSIAACQWLAGFGRPGFCGVSHNLLEPLRKRIWVRFWDKLLVLDFCRTPSQDQFPRRKSLFLVGKWGGTAPEIRDCKSPVRRWPGTCRCPRRSVLPPGRRKAKISDSPT